MRQVNKKDDFDLLSYALLVLTFPTVYFAFWLKVANANFILQFY